MTNIERLVPHILNQLDLRKWPRQARLIALVAVRTQDGGDVWTSIGLRTLTDYAGGNRQRAKWDLELMRQLARGHRVLDYAERGGHPALWQLRGRELMGVLRWRHVPWLVPRSRLIEEIEGDLLSVSVAWLDALAAQRPYGVSVESPGDQLAVSATRENMPVQPSAPPRQPSAPPRRFRSGPGQAFVKEFTTDSPATVGTPLPGGHTFPSINHRSVNTPSLPLTGGVGGETEKQGAREGGCASQTRANRLVGALEEATSLSFFGSLAERLVALAAAAPGAEDVLLAYVASHSLRRFRSASAVVELLERHWADAGEAKQAEMGRAAKCAVCGVYPKSFDQGPCGFSDCPRACR